MGREEDKEMQHSWELRGKGRVRVEYDKKRALPVKASLCKHCSLAAQLALCASSEVAAADAN